MGANDRQVAGNHYKQMGVEPWDVVDTWPIDQRIGAYRHGALKYLMRMGNKDQELQEIKKAAHYVEKLIECLTQHQQVTEQFTDAYEAQYNFDRIQAYAA